MATQKKCKRDLLDELLVYGYIKTQIHMAIPTDIHRLIYMFYHLLAVILTFSDTMKSKTGISLSEDKTYAIKLDIPGVHSGHRYALTTADPVYHGIHCWRILVKIIITMTNQ